MARFDIRPYRSAHGSHTRTLTFQMGAGSTATGEDTAWLEGYIMEVDPAVGDINPATNGNVDPKDFATGGTGGGAHGGVYIAAGSSQGLMSRQVGPSNVSGITAGQISDILVPVWEFLPDVEFITANVFSNSDTLVDLDTGFQIGDGCDLWVDDSTATMAGHNHGLDINTTNTFVITGKLDSLGQSSLVSGNTTTHVLFRIKV